MPTLDYESLTDGLSATLGDELNSRFTAIKDVVNALPAATDVDEAIAIALRGLDPQNSVLDKDLATPPGSPADGARYIVAGSPTGAWTGHATHIAQWDDDEAEWIFTTPNEGALLRVEDENLYYSFSGSAWEIYKPPILDADLPDTAVTPGTYGDGSNIPQLTISAKGRITGAVDVPVDIPSGDSLSHTVTATAHSLAAYKLIRFNSSGVPVVGSNADAASSEVVGMVGADPDTDAFTLITGGRIELVGATLTPGRVYCLGTDGDYVLDEDVPTTPGAVYKEVFHAESATVAVLDVQQGNVNPPVVDMATQAELDAAIEGLDDGTSTFIRTTTGAPVDTPTEPAGRVAMRYDPASDTLYVHSGAGVWKSTVLT